jgi:transcriptional regulator with XRE-family HTH domain
VRKSSPQTLDDKAIYAHIGKRIRIERKALGFEQKDLAQEVELARTSIVNIEAGRQAVSIHVLFKIARALAVDISELLPEEDDENAD